MEKQLDLRTHAHTHTRVGHSQGLVAGAACLPLMPALRMFVTGRDQQKQLVETQTTWLKVTPHCNMATITLVRAIKCVWRLSILPEHAPELQVFKCVDWLKRHTCERTKNAQRLAYLKQPCERAGTIRCLCRCGKRVHKGLLKKIGEFPQPARRQA